MPTSRPPLPEPMYATLAHDVPRGADWTFEPKYDGMRVVAEGTARSARLVTRNGKEKGAQFPEIIAALRALAAAAGRSVTLDGEVVASARRRRAAANTSAAASGFQQLQARMHLKDAAEIARLAIAAPATLVAFDLLRDGRSKLTALPWMSRRSHLEALFKERSSSDTSLILSATSARGATMLAKATREGWEGVIAKRTTARYQTGVRSEDWLKLKLQFRAEFVVGGFTEPRRARPHLGALLLGAYDEHGAFVYVGHMGGGFTHAGLREMRARLDRIGRVRSPFAVAPRTNEPAHWVSPKVIVEVKFAEWTSDRLLRQPILLGVRDDKAPRDVTLEAVSVQRWRTGELADDAA